MQPSITDLMTENDLVQMMVKNPSLRIKGKQEKGTVVPRLVEKAAKGTQHVASPPTKKDYKAELLQQLALVKIPAPVSEFRFHPVRKWRFDFAFVEQKVAIEYQGGIYQQGKQGHQTTSGIVRDCLKFSEAAAMGWRMLLVNAGMVRDGSAVTLIEKTLDSQSSFICVKCWLRQDPIERHGEPPF